MFQFTRSVLLADSATSRTGLPHSGTRGSMLTCSSPRLFAAYRAFLRLETPRHPPYALGSLTFAKFQKLRLLLVSFFS